MPKKKTYPCPNCDKPTKVKGAICGDCFLKIRQNPAEGKAEKKGGGKL